MGNLYPSFVTFHPLEHTLPFTFHHSSPVVIDYPYGPTYTKHPGVPIDATGLTFDHKMAISNNTAIKHEIEQND